MTTNQDLTIAHSIQEVILSAVYIFYTLKILRNFLRPEATRIMRQLLFINVLIINMNIALVAVEYASLFILETTLKGFIYSIKLKLGFAILSQLSALVGGNSGLSGSSISNSGQHRGMDFLDASEERKNSITKSRHIERLPRLDTTDFVDRSKFEGDYTHPTSPERSRSHSGRLENEEIDT